MLFLGLNTRWVSLYTVYVFAVRDPKLWDNLPEEIMSAESVNSFKSLLKTESVSWFYMSFNFLCAVFYLPFLIPFLSFPTLYWLLYTKLLFICFLFKPDDFMTDVCFILLPLWSILSQLQGKICLILWEKVSSSVNYSHFYTEIVQYCHNEDPSLCPLVYLHWTKQRRHNATPVCDFR